MEEPTTSDTLPAEEQISVWNETEQKFWIHFEQEQEAKRAAAENDYSKATMGVRIELGTLSGKKAQLVEQRDRLARELAAIEQDIARTVASCDDRATRLIAMEQEYRKKEHERLATREQIIKSMDTFFRSQRGENPRATAAPTSAPCPGRLPLRDIVSNLATPQAPREERPPRHALPSKAPIPPSGQSTPTSISGRPEAVAGPNRPVEALVNVTDADGNVVGPVERIEPWNQWVKEIQNLPVKRDVKIRRGRKFNKDHLATIYDRSEGKGVKFLSCMIQATGEIQSQRCHSCDKNQGAFDDCIILGGPLFQKCGNCEWNRQGCHMPLVTKSSSSGTPTKGHFSVKPLELDPHAAPAMAGISHPTADAVAKAADIAKAAIVAKMPMEHAQTSRDLDAPRSGQVIHKSPPMGHEPVQMPTPQEPKEHSFATPSYVAAPTFMSVMAPGSVSGFTPANARSRPPSREILTPSAASVEGSPRLMSTSDPTSGPLEEITRENLVLRHNGVVYTYPEIVEGVPLAKIDQNHPYWELGWPCIKSIIEPQLETWKEKNLIALQATARGEGGSAKFQTGRQVNRGAKIIEFLENGEISPYQLLGKKYTHTGKGAITSYDTLFRLCETLSELAKYNLDVTPVEWLRHRLHEIMLEKGSNFNVSKTIHDFYHDPKLSALRSKNGYKSIGRPSGLKVSLGNDTPQSSLKKRKSMHSHTSTPRETPPAGPSPPFVAHEIVQSPASTLDSENSFDSRLQKRVKHGSPPLAEITRGIPDTDFSDTDSFSGAPLAFEDWRLYQVKTRLFTSSSQVTQYWTWKEKERLFEHQLLKDTDPVSWGVHREPIDFSVKLDDIVEVRWNVDALQVHLVMSAWASAVAKQDNKPRGDVMAAFKRERTIRRFLSFCRDRRLRTVEVSAEEMDSKWAEIQSERLPAQGEEASEVLKE
ncbi:hypothetical protein HIM_08545 [Hirsutella minnesotensis 3608]|uniref:Uncharacterized protein n=1 Tax=Hirsutella minnesotensis 3608 TaxID=1043627 RepID=A0A0F7ZMI5_9HYPO|nr:hypothetical protein HIM_08545 [Hirsutella minnesotensis 3608]